MLNRLILKTILQKNTVLKLMRYLASPLPETSSIKKVLRGILVWINLNRWNSSLVETSYTKFLNSPTSGENVHVVIKKKIIIWLELVSKRRVPLKYSYSGFFFFFGILFKNKKLVWLELVSSSIEI